METTARWCRCPQSTLIPGWVLSALSVSCKAKTATTTPTCSPVFLKRSDLGLGPVLTALISRILWTRRTASWPTTCVVFRWLWRMARDLGQMAGTTCCVEFCVERSDTHRRPSACKNPACSRWCLPSPRAWARFSPNWFGKKPRFKRPFTTKKWRSIARWVGAPNCLPKLQRKPDRAR